MGREHWLNLVIQQLIVRLPMGEIPKFNVSVGFPRGARGSKKLCGQVVPAEKTIDGSPHVFITPIAENTEEALIVLLSLIAELKALKTGQPLRDCLYALRLKETKDHFRPFDFLSKEDAHAIVSLIEGEVGVYPKIAVKKEYERARDTAGIKVFCETTDYKIRTSSRWLDKYGAPICPCCNKKMSVDR